MPIPVCFELNFERIMMGLGVIASFLTIVGGLIIAAWKWGHWTGRQDEFKATRELTYRPPSGAVTTPPSTTPDAASSPGTTKSGKGAAKGRGTR